MPSPSALTSLGPGAGDCTASQDLDSTLGVATPAKSGFNFTYTPGAANAAGIVDSFTINADPWSEAGTRAPTGPANPDGKSWADLDELTRRQVVDGWRLAYIAEELVNWSPGLGTVLANEEVTAEGRSDVGNYPVYRRPLRQWLLRITAYAERLLADLDELDWPEPIKQQQRNWIGPSDGAVVTFDVAGPSGLRIEAFTTRPETAPASSSGAPAYFGVDFSSAGN